MRENPTATAASPPLPSPRVLNEGAEILHELQLILANMGKDDRRQSPEFQEIMAQYKLLGAELHEARKKVATASPVARVAPAPPRSVSALGNVPRPAFPKPVLPRPAPVTSVSALSRARAAYGAVPPAAHRPPVSANTSVQVPVSAGPAPSPPPEEVVAALPETGTPEAGAVLQPSSARAELPLKLPKFMSSLGPAGSRAINRGPEVKNLNELLTALGFDTPGGDVFDVKTYRAVSDFQKINRIPVNGMVGVDTRRQLNEMVTG